MVERAQARRYGTVFEEIADAYDRNRPTYPDALIDRACEAAGLDAGMEVLEIGCGTGQLTRSLLGRGLSVTAVEPGERLTELARARLAGAQAGTVRFINARLEDAPLRGTRFHAVFSASAIHWVDPELSWRRIADALVDGGTLALISYFGLADPRSNEDQAAIRDALAGVAPEPAAQWPIYRDLEQMLAGAEQRRNNASKLWAWLGSYDVAREYAEPLFSDAQLAVLPSVVEHTGAQLIALLATMSFWAQLSTEQREALGAAIRMLEQQLGRPIRSSVAACLLSAQRVPRI